MELLFLLSGYCFFDFGHCLVEGGGVVGGGVGGLEMLVGLGMILVFSDVMFLWWELEHVCTQWGHKYMSYFVTIGFIIIVLFLDMMAGLILWRFIYLSFSIHFYYSNTVYLMLCRMLFFSLFLLRYGTLLQST